MRRTVTAHTTTLQPEPTQQPQQEQIQQPILQPQPVQENQQPAYPPAPAVTTSPQVQAQQAKINRMTNVVAQWSSGDQYRMEKPTTPMGPGKHTTTAHQICPQLYQITMDSVGIMTSRAVKVTTLTGDRYVIKEGFLIHLIITLAIITLIF